MFKKMTAICLCVFMLCCALPLSAAATDGVTYTVETKTVDGAIKAGEEFTLTVSIGNVDALACIECKLRYDKTLMSAVSSTKEGFLKDCIMSDANIAPIAPETSDPNKYGEVWITGLADGNYAASGVLTTITFKANKDITGDADVFVFKTPIAAQANMTQYVCEVVAGGVKVSGAATTPDTPDTPDAPDTPDTPVTPTEPVEGTVTTTAVDTQTTQTTAKQNSIEVPEGNVTPMQTTTAKSASNDNAQQDDSTTLIVFIVIAVAAVAAAAVTVALRMKKKS